MTKTDSQLSKVQLQAPGIPGEYAAYDTGERWNGAVCPLFNRVQAENFAKAYSNAHEDHEAWYDEEQDAFCFDSPEGLDCFPSVRRGGSTYYPIGARCWIWTKV